MDKGTNNIADMPTKHEIKRLIMSWFNATGERGTIHSAAMNALIVFFILRLLNVLL